MAYKKYIKRGNRIYGPYTYESKRENGKVVTNYVGRSRIMPSSKSIKIFIFFSLLILASVLIYKYVDFSSDGIIIDTEKGITGNLIKEVSIPYTDGTLIFTSVPEKVRFENKNTLKLFWVNENMYLKIEVYDMDRNGYIDYIEWVAPANVISLPSGSFILVIKEGDASQEQENINLPKCSPAWSCTEWADCANGRQFRECEDLNRCENKTLLSLRRECVACDEDWDCEWSKCNEEGFTVPTCYDLNGCGTEFEKPSPIMCGGERDMEEISESVIIDMILANPAETGECYPSIECGNWSKCEITYSFENLLKNTNRTISGRQRRLCTDTSGCIEPIFQRRSCDIKTEVYAKNVLFCGKKYIQIYDKYTNELLSGIVDEAQGEIPSLDIEFTETKQIYCVHCFNGFQDEDEEGLDCGGPCPVCSYDTYKKDYLGKISFSLFLLILALVLAYNVHLITSIRKHIKKKPRTRI